jgi:hypothetical protein
MMDGSIIKFVWDLYESTNLIIDILNLYDKMRKR